MPASPVDDSNSKGINTIEMSSPRKLMSTNLADEMKLGSGNRSKICSIAIERDAAILAGGIVAYQNEVKHDLLGVDEEILEKYGAVSEQTVKAMAEGARQKFNCEWAVATSGIAGPTGAEPGKPVGTVWMCVASSLQNEAFCEIFAGNREQIRKKSVYKIMGRLLFLLNSQKSTCTKVH